MNCIKCGAPLNIIKAGISKSSGKPYSAFYVCPSKCELKGLMDTRVKVDPRPEGWDKTAETLGKKTDFGKSEMDMLIEINAKCDKIIEKQGQINTELGDY